MITAIASLLLTVLIYWGSKRLYRIKPIVLLSPLLVTPIVLIFILVKADIPYDVYNTGGKWLSNMVGPATVALAIPLHKNFHVLKKHAVKVIVGTLAGSAMGFLTSIGIAHLLHLDSSLMSSLMLRSTTTAIAIAVSNQIGAISSITAVIVLITGLLGMTIGPFVIRTLRIRNDIAKGVMLGTSAHNAGTRKALDLSDVSGAIATISMILSAFLTIGIAPWLMSHL